MYEIHWTFEINLTVMLLRVALLLSHGIGRMLAMVTTSMCQVCFVDYAERKVLRKLDANTVQSEEFHFD